jgi:hypothetical protein
MKMAPVRGKESQPEGNGAHERKAELSRRKWSPQEENGANQKKMEPARGKWSQREENGVSGFQELWKLNHPSKDLPVRRRNVQFGWISKRE